MISRVSQLRTLAFSYSPLKLILDLLGLLGHLLDEPPQDVGLAGQLVQLARGQAALLQDAVETRQLLGGVVVVLGQLVEDAQVVLGVLVLRLLLEGVGLLLGLLGGVGQRGAARELGDDAVEGGDGAGAGAEETSGQTVRLGLLVEEDDKVLLASAARVIVRCLVALGEELDGRV